MVSAFPPWAVWIIATGQWYDQDVIYVNLGLESRKFRSGYLEKPCQTQHFQFIPGGGGGKSIIFWI